MCLVRSGTPVRAQCAAHLRAWKRMLPASFVRASKVRLIYSIYKHRNPYFIHNMHIKRCKRVRGNDRACGAAVGVRSLQIRCVTRA